MSKTLYKVNLDGKWSNKEEKIAKILNNIPGVSVVKTYRFKLLFVEIDESYPNATGSLKAVNGVKKIRKEGD